MTASATEAAPLPKQTGSFYMIFVMTTVATLCGVLIVTVYQLTIPAIQRNQARIIEASVYEVLPGATRQVAFGVEPSGTLTENPDPQSSLPKCYAGYDDQGALVGVAVQASGRGYQDIIQLLYSYSPDKECIDGFTVLDCKETPGLGDKIVSDPAFLANFKDLDTTLDASGQAMAHPIETVKHGTKTEKWQIDAISGATISSKAVSRILRESTAQMVPVIAAHLDEIRKAGTHE